jgi:hypothetical protein
MKTPDDWFEENEKSRNRLLLAMLALSAIIGVVSFKVGQKMVQDEAINRGHAEMHELEFRWVNCKMKGMTVDY